MTSKWLENKAWNLHLIQSGGAECPSRTRSKRARPSGKSKILENFFF